MVNSSRRPRRGRDPGLKKPLIISVLFHGALVILAIFGLPHILNKPEIMEPVPVEIVATIGEMTTTNKPPVKAPPPVDPKKEEPPPPKKTIPPKPLPSNEAAPPPDEVLKDPKPDDKLPDKKPEPVKKVEPKKPKEPKKETKKDDTEDFNKLLKNLSAADPPQPETPDNDAKPKKSTPQPSPDISKFSEVLSMSERDALIQQLAGCWNVPVGSANAESLSVDLTVTVSQDRTVQSVQIVDTSRYNSDSFFRAAADAAKRALQNPKCTPLNLPPDKYSLWHEMTITFDPKDMF